MDIVGDIEIHIPQVETEIQSMVKRTKEVYGHNVKLKVPVIKCCK